MRTTLDIDDDVLITAKSVARRECKTLGRIVSDLARASLQRRGQDQVRLASGKKLEQNDVSRRLKDLGLVPYSAPKGRLVTNEMVRKLIEEEGI